MVVCVGNETVLVGFPESHSLLPCEEVLLRYTMLKRAGTKNPHRIHWQMEDFSCTVSYKILLVSICSSQGRRLGEKQLSGGSP